MKSVILTTLFIFKMKIPWPVLTDCIASKGWNLTSCEIVISGWKKGAFGKKALLEDHDIAGFYAKKLFASRFFLSATWPITK